MYLQKWPGRRSEALTLYGDLQYRTISYAGKRN